MKSPKKKSRLPTLHLLVAIDASSAELVLAVQRDVHFQACYDALVARGKKPKQALVAIIRKLLHAIGGMLRHAQNFDPTKFYQLPKQALENLAVTP